MTERSEFFPGSRQRITPPSGPPDLLGDMQGKEFTLPSGQKVELFTIGQVAKVLNRSTVTIRKWIKAGYMPKPTFKKASKDPRGVRNMYSREQVQSLVRVAHEEGLITNQYARIQQTKFPERSRTAFKVAR